MTHPPKRLAIIGTGISGLGAAYLLRHSYDITVYEQESRPGGHARTVTIDYDGAPISVDTGFIVFNYRNYPYLTALFEELAVPVEKSDMSLGLSLENGRFEWGCASLGAVFAQPANILRRDFWRMLRDMFRFNKQARAMAGEDDTLTLGALLDRLGMSEAFRNRFLLPTAGAIWSSSPEQITDFPARSFLTFFDNHGLLSINDQPQWYTVTGGSKEYVRRITDLLGERLRLGSPVRQIECTEGGVRVLTHYGESEHYDAVILATHSDQALKLLGEATRQEWEILSDIPYQNNRAYLHRDPSFMPRRRACWASWNYLCDSAVDERTRITVTYWMNRLQNIDPDKPLFVTLNPPQPPAPELIFDEYMFDHPVYDTDMLAAQRRMEEIQGKGGVWYCGAWQRYGFHEDGLASAVNVARQLGADVPWQEPQT